MANFLEQRQAVADLLKEPRDTLTIYVNGEYFPAKIEHHDNDVVSQFVVVVDNPYDSIEEAQAKEIPAPGC